MRRELGLDPASGLLAAVVVHVALYFFAGSIDPPEREPKRELIEVEMIELPEPKPPEPPPPPEPEVEPEVKPPEPEPPEPEPEVKPKKPPPTKTKVDPPKADPKPEPEPEAAPKPKRFELPPSATVPAGSGSAVKVNNGSNTGSGSNSGSGTGTGTKPGTGGNGPGGGNGTGAKPADAWAPKNDLYIAQQPRPLRIPELECPAVTDRQIEGTVVLMVQVQRDGKVRSARVTQKLGYGCDDIAKKALKTAKFAPAMGTDGKAADYELRYEYAFELKN